MAVIDFKIYHSHNYLIYRIGLLVCDRFYKLCNN